MCVCVLVWEFRSNNRDQSTVKRGDAMKWVYTIKHLSLSSFLFLGFFFFTCLWTDIWLLLLFVWRFSSVTLHAFDSVCSVDWVKSPPKWCFSFFLFVLYCFRQMLSESCYYYNEFCRCFSHRLKIYTHSRKCVVCVCDLKWWRWYYCYWRLSEYEQETVSVSFSFSIKFSMATEKSL